MQWICWKFSDTRVGVLKTSFQHDIIIKLLNLAKLIYVCEVGNNMMKHDVRLVIVKTGEKWREAIKLIANNLVPSSLALRKWNRKMIQNCYECKRFQFVSKEFSILQESLLVAVSLPVPNELWLEGEVMKIPRRFKRMWKAQRIFLSFTSYLRVLCDFDELFESEILCVAQHWLCDMCWTLHASHFEQHFLNSLISLRIEKLWNFSACSNIFCFFFAFHLHPPTSQRVSCERKIYLQCFSLVTC